MVYFLHNNNNNHMLGACDAISTASAANPKESSTPNLNFKYLVLTRRWQQVLTGPSIILIGQAVRLSKIRKFEWTFVPTTAISLSVALPQKLILE